MKYIIIKIPDYIDVEEELKLMDKLKTIGYDFQWYNNAEKTNEELFV